MKRLVVAVVLVVLAVPAVALGSSAADLAVLLSIVDDASEPQRVRVTLTNQGPTASSHPILELDVGSGAEVVSHTGDPQPGSLADGVGCAARPGGFSCQWEELAAGAQAQVEVQVGVSAASTAVATAEAAGTPDPNPSGNNMASVGLSPATTDLAVAVAVALEDRAAALTVTLTHVAGRADAAGLGIAPAPAVAPAGCAVEAGRARCPVTSLAVGEEAVFEALVERPPPGSEPLVVSVAAAPATYDDPVPADNTVEVEVPPREGVAGAVVRLAGAERIATAVAVSQAGFAAASAGAVVLARADVFADALAGAPLAAVVGGPVLLSPGPALADATRAELGRVLPAGGSVYLLGGTAALGRGVEEAVVSAGYRPVRVAGPNRYATSAAIDAVLGHPVALAYADGDTFADALLAGSAMAARGGAVLLTSGEVLPPETASRAGDAVYAVGGAAAQAVPGARHALVGATPAETSVLVATELFADPTAVGLATSGAFPDALAGAPHAAALGGPVLLGPPPKSRTPRMRGWACARRRARQTQVQ